MHNSCSSESAPTKHNVVILHKLSLNENAQHPGIFFKKEQESGDGITPVRAKNKASV